jgi:DNA-binding NtrC family response regulator
MAQILIVDDDKAFREGLSETLGDLGHSVREAISGEDALAQLRYQAVDLIFLDVRMGDMNGLEVLKLVRADSTTADLPVIILTACAGSANTIEAMKLGAFDHLTKPVGRDDISNVLARALTRPQAKSFSEHAEDDGEEGLAGTSKPMRAVHKLIGLAAAGDATVLITGETGTGKERVARALHTHSARAPKPFVAVNCAAIPTDLLESELFGHTRGAFTGAVTDSQGRFREANGGTLFLDEIGDMTLPMQAKILRVLEEREIRPLGDTKSYSVDIRILAATHRDLMALVTEGKFREDLFYRLNVIRIHVPPLRERGFDILLLAEYFLQRAAQSAPKQLTTAAAKALLEYDWPGNVRELENLMQRLSVVVRGPVIDRSDLFTLMKEPESGPTLEDLLHTDFHAAVASVEKYLIERALLKANGNRAEAARLLGMQRQLLYAKMKEHGIQD